jgi:hypothetical protein
VERFSTDAMRIEVPEAIACLSCKLRSSIIKGNGHKGREDSTD